MKNSIFLCIILVITTPAVSGLYGQESAKTDSKQGFFYFDPGVKNKILISPYGGAGFSHAWGTLNFTGVPVTGTDLAWNAGIRIAYPAIWWGGVIAGLEYSRNPVTRINNYYGIKVRETETLHYVKALLGWRQYVWVFYYGTGFFAGYAAGPAELKTSAGGVNVKAGKSLSPISRFTMGLYTEVGCMFTLSESVTLDITAQLQASVLDRETRSHLGGSSSYKPMLFVMIAGVTVRVK